MQRIDSATAAAAMPAQAPPGTPGYWTNGDPSVPTPPTIFDQDFFNNLQEELCFVVEQASIPLDKTNRTQLFAALNVLFTTQAWVTANFLGLLESTIAACATAMGFAASFGSTGYIKLPSWLGGLIAQWGETSGTSPVSVTFPVTFPTACMVALTTPASSTNNTYSVNVETPTQTGFTAHPNTGDAGTTLGFFWLVFGY